MLEGREPGLGPPVPKSWDKWLGADRCKQFRGTWGAADSNESSVPVPPGLPGWARSPKGRHTSWPAEPEHLSASNGCPRRGRPAHGKSHRAS